MDDAAQIPQRVRFGAFEVDLRAGELWRAGRKRKLTGQPFLVLAILLERPGEVVTREELQKRLWPDTFVDVDHNLNAAINKIREALDDSAEHPRFVETLPRRGYRFIAPVEVVKPASPSIPSLSFASDAGSTTIDMSAETARSAPGNQATPTRKFVSRIPKRARPPVWIALVAAAFGGIYFLRPTLPPPQVTGVTQLTMDGAPKLFGVGPPPWPLLTDGSRIYFVEGYLNRRLMQVSTNGGEVIPIEIPIPFYGLADMSPTRLELLFKGPPAPLGWDLIWGQNMGLWALPVPGGQPRRIGDALINDATFAQNENAIFYSAGHTIFRANDDGSQPHKILSISSGLPFWLRISPDKTLLRFSVYNPILHTSSLWEAHVDGSNLRQLLAGWENPANECCGSWASDGKYFVFQSMHEGVANLWAMREKGEWWRKVSHDPVRLTVGQMSSQSPLPNKDGTKIFFIGSVRKDEIIRYEPSTNSFIPYLSGLSAEGLTFTPDGKKITYVSYPEGILWESNIDGSDRHELSFPPMEVGLPRWSPDGTQIAFAAREPGKPWQLFVISAQGGDAEQITSGATNHEDGSWSPDGNSIAFGDNAADARRSKGNALFILNLKTHKIADVPDSAGLFSPRWSPDGRYLLAVTDDFQKLMLYDFTLRKWEVLANMPASYPNWSRDGKCVYFNGGGKSLTAYRVCLDDRKPERIVDLSKANTSLAFGRFGWWTGLGPNDSILATRDVGTEEIYALDTKFP